MGGWGRGVKDGQGEVVEPREPGLVMGPQEMSWEPGRHEAEEGPDRARLGLRAGHHGAERPGRSEGRGCGWPGR